MRIISVEPDPLAENKGDVLVKAERCFLWHKWTEAYTGKNSVWRNIDTGEYANGLADRILTGAYWVYLRKCRATTTDRKG